MSTVREYFSNISDTVTSIVTGMKITLKYCFQKTVTVQYPEQRLSLAPRYRGIHEFEANKCIACDLCAKACPVDCIYIDKTAPRRIDKNTGIVNTDDPKNGQLIRFCDRLQQMPLLRPVHRAMSHGLHPHGQTARPEQLQPRRCRGGIRRARQKKTCARRCRCGWNEMRRRFHG